jgi:hypothetical protein
MMKKCFKHEKLYQAGLALVSGLVLMGCGSDPAPAPVNSPPSVDTELVAYLKDNWGITVSGFRDTWMEYTAEDGTMSATGTGKITVDGLGTQELSTNTVVIPDEFGTTTSFFVSLPDGSDERYFLYDRMNNYVTIGNANDSQSVIVSANPDKTYQVDTAIGDAWTTVGTNMTGYQALLEVEKYNQFKSISPHIFLMAFAAAHTPSTLESRLIITCDQGLSMAAAAPAVCSIFREFCECAACSVLNKQGACSACPEL